MLVHCCAVAVSLLLLCCCCTVAVIRFVVAGLIALQQTAVILPLTAEQYNTTLCNTIPKVFNRQTYFIVMRAMLFSIRML